MTCVNIFVKEYVDYLKAYVTHFNLSDRILLGKKVVSVKRSASGAHTVSYIRRKSASAEEWSDGEHIYPAVQTKLKITICGRC